MATTAMTIKVGRTWVLLATLTATAILLSLQPAMVTCLRKVTRHLVVTWLWPPATLEQHVTLCLVLDSSLLMNS